MLKKKYRLKKNIAFSATFKLKNCKSNDFLTIYKGKEKKDITIPTKIGIVVSKKVHKRAVKRNKIKRRIKAIYLDFMKNNEIENLQKSISIIFIARSKILDLTYNEIKNTIHDLIQKF